MTETPTLSFPAGFLWGAASAAHQAEGNNVSNGHWHAENLPGAPAELRSGDADDFYHRWPEDFDLLVAAGLNTFRFSLEWSRIEPVEGHFSRAELAHYRRMIDGCFARGITPVVTVLHFSVPQWFEARGGWTADGALELFERFVDFVAPTLTDVPFVCTINEPNLMACIPVMIRMAQQGIPINGLPLPDQTLADAAIAAHRVAVRALRAAGVPRVGLCLAMHEFIAEDGGEAAVVERRYALEDQFLDATEGDDFIGVQSYTCARVGPEGLRAVRADEVETTQTGWEFWPHAIVGAVHHAWERTAGQIPILVTENGVATADDTRRIVYLDGALRGLAELVERGVDLRGYIHWAFHDNFEWMGAFNMTFGLVAVDLETFVRSPKPSLGWLGEVAQLSIPA